MGFRPQYNAKVLPTADGVVTGATTPGSLGGWSARESGGTNPVTFDIYDGTDTSGVLLGSVTIAAGASCVPFWAGGDDQGEGIKVGTGLYVDITGTGTLKGCVYFAG